MLSEEIKRLIPDYLEHCKTVNGRYKLISQLGEGRYGKVYLAFDLEVERLVALKRLKNHNLKGTLPSFCAEITSLIRISSFPQSISATKILDFSLNGINSDGKPIAYYIMEFVEMGELFVLLEEADHISENLACFFFCQLCESLAALHELSLLHLDLKPENVLVNQFGELVLCDFGNSAFLGSRAPKKPRRNPTQTTLLRCDSDGLEGSKGLQSRPELKGRLKFPELDKELPRLVKDNSNDLLRFLRKAKFLGSPEYSAPELEELETLQLRSQTDLKNTLEGFDVPDLTKLDVFSLGVLLFVIVMKSLPFGKASLLDAYYKRFVQSKEAFWKIFSKTRSVSVEFREIVEGMLEYSNKGRSRISNLRQHAWVLRNFADGMSSDQRKKSMAEAIRKSSSDAMGVVGKHIGSASKTSKPSSPNGSQRETYPPLPTELHTEIQRLLGARSKQILKHVEDQLERKAHRAKAGVRSSRQYSKEAFIALKEFSEKNRLKISKLSRILEGAASQHSLESLLYSGSDDAQSSMLTDPGRINSGKF